MVIVEAAVVVFSGSVGSALYKSGELEMIGEPEWRSFLERASWRRRAMTGLRRGPVSSGSSLSSPAIRRLSAQQRTPPSCFSTAATAAAGAFLESKNSLSTDSIVSTFYNGNLRNELQIAILV